MRKLAASAASALQVLQVDPHPRNTLPGQSCADIAQTANGPRGTSRESPEVTKEACSKSAMKPPLHPTLRELSFPRAQVSFPALRS